jgi:hypothetical protein
MSKPYLRLALLMVVVFGGILAAAQPVEKNQLAVVDSARLLQTLGQKYQIAALILNDYQLAIKKIPAVKGQEKAVEAKINQTLEEILAFYASQLIRPVMIEINRLVAEKKFVAIINKSAFKLEEVLLQGEDSRSSGGAPLPRNPALEKLERPFATGVYFSEHQAVEITDALLPFIDKHLQSVPLVRFSPQGATKENKK